MKKREVGMIILLSFMLPLTMACLISAPITEESNSDEAYVDAVSYALTATFQDTEFILDETRSISFLIMHTFEGNFLDKRLLGSNLTQIEGWNDGGADQIIEVLATPSLEAFEGEFSYIFELKKTSEGYSFVLGGNEIPLEDFKGILLSSIKP